MLFYLICYDIGNDKIRRRLALLLEKQGALRIQKSVFLAHLKEPGLQKILARLRLIQPRLASEDSIMLIPMAPAHLKDTLVIGQREILDELLNPQITMFF